ncbi:MAG: NADH-quinone oxidoreductase subunit NuoK [Candidatus Schekmanbacteria bacterium]|nr:NADH-quinone oxidoreductase subunit NuoK [Candidatus Schekmanbacteria bacterium]
MPLIWYLMLSFALFIIGLIGVLIRRNVVVVLMSIELIMNAVNINMVVFSRYLPSTTGQIFTIFSIVVAAAEAALGLALIVAVYRNSKTVNVDEISIMKW